MMSNQPDNPCCPLGAALYQERLLYESDHFFVVPTVGSMGIQGYVLVLSKEHYEGTGDVPKEHFRELSEVLRDTRKVLQSELGVASLAFEHGPRVCPTPKYEIRGGGCLDHAHIHVVPGVDVTNVWANDLLTRLETNGQYFGIERVEGFERAAQTLEGSRASYLMLETPDQRRFFSQVGLPIPSQYFRRMIAEQVGLPNWNWRLHPDRETLQRTVEILKGKF